MFIMFSVQTSFMDSLSKNTAIYSSIVYNGLDTISFRGYRLWQVPPNDIKKSDIVSNFKKESKPGKERDANADYVDLSWPWLGF